MAEKELKGTKSLENLKEAFAGESQANPPVPVLRPAGGH